MSKMSVFVISYSVFLIILFATLCYLISNINPPEKPDTAKFEDADYLLSANEVPPYNKIGYGLEKAYNAIDPDPSISRRINTTIFKSVCNSTDASKWRIEKQTNCTRGPIIDFRSIPKSMKPVKDRRSINEDNQLEHEREAPRSLLLKIKGVDGQARIEINLVSELLKNNKRRKYRSSGTKTISNSSSKSNYLELDSDTSIRGASVVTAENGTFILNVFANSIAIITDNDTHSFEYENNLKKNDCYNNNQEMNSTENPNKNNETGETFVIKSSTPSDIESINATRLFTLNLLNNNFTKTLNSLIENNTSKNVSTNTLSSEKDEYSSTMVKSQDNLSTLHDTLEQRTLLSQNETTTQKITDNISLSTTEHIETSFENEATVLDEAETNAISANLEGLLIPEVTALLPVDN